MLWVSCLFNRWKIPILYAYLNWHIHICSWIEYRPLFWPYLRILVFVLDFSLHNDQKLGLFKNCIIISPSPLNKLFWAFAYFFLQWEYWHFLLWFLLKTWSRIFCRITIFWSFSEFCLASWFFFLHNYQPLLKLRNVLKYLKVILINGFEFFFFLKKKEKW